MSPRIPEECHAQKIEDVTGVGGGGPYLDGRVYLAGQPDENALAELGRRGVAVVVNVRTPGELADRDEVPFGEAKVVGELGLEYVTIPLGGDDHPYGPDAVAKLAEVFEDHDAPILIHCGYGSRATYLWIAYQVRYEGVSLPETLLGQRSELMRHGSAIRQRKGATVGLMPGHISL